MPSPRVCTPSYDAGAALQPPLEKSHSDNMHLVACPSPQEPLEDAPRSALLADLTEGERWEGFWSSDAYFVRCTRSGGEVEWFKLADDASLDKKSLKGAKEPTRVLNFPPRARLQTRVVVAKSPDGRRMLVGTAGRVAGRSSTPRTSE
jgi:hypothetical protein